LSVEFVISVYVFPSLVGDLIDITMNRYRDLEDLEDLSVYFGPEGNGQFITRLNNEICSRRLSTELESESVCEIPSKKEIFDLVDNVQLVQEVDELTKCGDKNQIDISNSEFVTELCCDDVDIILDNVFKVRSD